MKVINKDTEIRWGIIGAGDVCEKKSGPGFYKAPGSTLQAITKRDPEAAVAFAGRHSVPTWYTDPKQLIQDPAVDAVYVATPPHLHRRFAEDAMRAGKPVLVEKPMATNAVDCDAMIECSIATGSALWVAYYRRGLEKFVAIKGAIEEGVIGEPRSVSIELSQNRARYASDGADSPWRVNPAIAGGGVIADMGSHMLDLVDWLLGPIAVSSSVVTNRSGDYAAEDLVGAVFTAGVGATGEAIKGVSTAAGAAVVGTAVWDFAGRRECDHTVIRGSEGAIEFSTFDDRPAVIEDNGTRREMPSYPFPPHVHQPLIELINAELRGADTSPSTATSGARTNRVLDAILGEYYLTPR